MPFGDLDFDHTEDKVPFECNSLNYCLSISPPDPNVVALNRDSFGFTYDKKVGEYTAFWMCSSIVKYRKFKKMLFVYRHFLIIIIHIIASL